MAIIHNNYLFDRCHALCFLHEKYKRTDYLYFKSSDVVPSKSIYHFTTARLITIGAKVTMVSADNLNHDVLHLIFAFLNENDIFSVSQVSRSFLAAVIPRLYRRLYFRLGQAKKYPKVNICSTKMTILNAARMLTGHSPWISNRRHLLRY